MCVHTPSSRYSCLWIAHLECASMCIHIYPDVCSHTQCALPMPMDSSPRICTRVYTNMSCRCVHTHSVSVACDSRPRTAHLKCTRVCRNKSYKSMNTHSVYIWTSHLEYAYMCIQIYHIFVCIHSVCCDSSIHSSLRIYIYRCVIGMCVGMLGVRYPWLVNVCVNVHNDICTCTHVLVSLHMYGILFAEFCCVFCILRPKSMYVFVCY